MDNTGDLLVGTLSVSSAEGVDHELLAVFRDDMLRVERAPTDVQPGSPPAPDDETAVFRAPGPVIAKRLDLMGIDETQVLADLDRALSASAEPATDAQIADYDEDSRAYFREEERLLGSMTARDWVSRLAVSNGDPGAEYDRTLGARGWLLSQLDGDDQDWDDRRRLRAVLLAFPDAEVSLDVTWMHEWDWLGGDRDSLASRAQGASRDNAASHAPVIVLTEGATDAEFLGAALAVLHPHLTDLVRFLDYERKPEGSASAVLRTARAFDAAGVANRVVAVLDNDTAAADALRGHGLVRPSGRIQVIRYPDLDLARHYPTIGPPAVGAASATSAADVNGLAGSIELYLGRDVLTGPDGSLRPVQWTSLIAGMGRYQGEVTGKNDIHKAFRAKAAAASRDAAVIRGQDWDGLRLILDAVFTAFA
jgi:hypothetical protein